MALPQQGAAPGSFVASIPPEATPKRASSYLGRVLGFLRNHPIVCLFLLTPGLVEYLSGSSSFVFLVISPAWFFLALGINAAMYTSGALLIREAWIRWNKGWPTVFALGGAYAIMEEGIADQTIFNPMKSPIGAAGLYGHFHGVNWLWVPDIFYIHILMSLLIPILLLNYALPETRGRSLLTQRQIILVLTILALDTAFLTAIVARSNHYWYGFPLLFLCVLAIVGMCALGRFLPKQLIRFSPGAPTASRLAFFLVGCFAYPWMVFITILGAGKGFPPAAVLLAILASLLLVFVWAVRHIGSERNERHMLAFGVGLLMIGFLRGLVVEFPLEIVAFVDLVVIYFFVWLDRELAQRERQTTVPSYDGPAPVAGAAP